MGQAPARSYMPLIYKQIVNGEIDPTSIITHTLPLADAAHGYHIFNNKQEDCIKVVLKP
jgi:S-(hydroxymethyl)glutathione dehydrogenase/alcohol dehydrogenase